MLLRRFQVRISVLLASAILALLICPSRAEEGDVKITEISDSTYPGMLGWKVDYEKPTEAPNVFITLSYKFWDPKADGDAYSEKKLNVVTNKKSDAVVSFRVFLDAKKSVILLNGTAHVARGYPLDGTFAVANNPKRNYDGFYVLAQRSVDPKKPSALGDTQNAAAWIDLAVTTNAP